MTAESIYKRLVPERDRYLERARACARFACPSLLPLDNEGKGGNDEPRDLPFNGLGMQGFNNMSSRLALTLLPATELPFRYVIDEIAFAEEEAKLLAGVAEEDRDQRIAEIAAQRSAIDQSLARIERGLMMRMETDCDRPSIHEMCQHLIAAGNALMWDDRGEGLRCITMPHYVIRRRPSGKPAEVVIRDDVEFDELPEEAKALVPNSGERGHREHEEEVSVYTHIRWDRERVRWQQEICGKPFGDGGSAASDESPWIPVRMSQMHRRNYSPGYLEMVAIADLQTADNLAQAVTELAHISAQVRHLCRPGSSAKPEDLMKVPNGGFGVGTQDDIFTLSVNKLGDMRAAMEALGRVEDRTKIQFMLTQFRDSERTTATEISEQVRATDIALGGIYSILVTEFQAPYVRRKLARMLRESKLPRLPPIARPVVSVGLGAVGRGTDLARLNQFMQAATAFLGPEQVGRYVVPTELFGRLASATSLVRDGLVRSQESVDETNRQQAQQQQQIEMMRAGMADPQKLANAAANAAATAGSPGQEPPPPGPQ